jgi:hypothetical protein
MADDATETKTEDGVDVLHPVEELQLVMHTAASVFQTIATARQVFVKPEPGLTSAINEASMEAVRVARCILGHALAPPPAVGAPTANSSLSVVPALTAPAVAPTGFRPPPQPLPGAFRQPSHQPIVPITR